MKEVTLTNNGSLEFDQNFDFGNGLNGKVAKLYAIKGGNHYGAVIQLKDSCDAHDITFEDGSGRSCHAPIPFPKHTKGKTIRLMFWADQSEDSIVEMLPLYQEYLKTMGVDEDEHGAGFHKLASKWNQLVLEELKQNPSLEKADEVASKLYCFDHGMEKLVSDFDEDIQKILLKDCGCSSRTDKDLKSNMIMQPRNGGGGYPVTVK